MLKKMTLAVRDRVGKAYSAGSRVMALVFGRSFVERYPWAFGALLGGIAFYLFSDLFAILSGRVWYADGSWWFVRFLRDQKPSLNTVSRVFGQSFIQMPAYLAVKCGIRSLPILTALFSAPFFLQFFLSLLICAWATGLKNSRYLLFPLISLFAGSMNGTMMIVNEGLLMVSLYWALLFFILFCEHFNLWKTFVFSVTAFVSLQTYESMAYFGMILGALAIWRSWREGRNSARRGIWILAAVWFLIGALIAIQEIIVPTYPRNFEGFKVGCLSIISAGLWEQHPMLFLSLAALFFLSVPPFLAGRLGKRVFSVSIRIFYLFSIFLGLTALFSPGWVHPANHYHMRGFYCFLPVPLTFVLLGLRVFQKFQKREAWVRGFMIVVVLACAQITWQIFATMQWRRYRSAFCESLASHKGILTIEQAGMDPEALMKRGIVDMGWHWTYPVLSILMKPAGKICAMIEPLPADSKIRYIFNAHHPAERPDLSAYGIVYEIEGDKSGCVP